MTILANVLMMFGSVMIVVGSLLFFRARDVYGQIQFLKIINIYGLSILLLGIAIDRFSTHSLVKIISLIILNIIVTLIITQSAARRAMIAGIKPQGEVKKVE